MARAVIIDAVRSPMAKGKATGALAGVHPVDLLGQVLAAIVARHDLDPAAIDDVVIGCVGQNGEQAATPGRQASLSAGFPAEVPSMTIERKCGSGQQAVDIAAWGIGAGVYDVALAGGVESMSRVPMSSNRMGADPFGPRVHARFPDLVPQGLSAELVSRKWSLTREQLDSYSAESHRRADAARGNGGFRDEIVAISVPGTDRSFDTDETIRPGSTAESLGSLKLAFASDENRARFPGLDFTVTAGNASQITDGASVLLLMSEQRATELGLRPRARIVASAVCGDDPTLMLTGPIPATRKVLERAKLKLDDIDAVEINEAFASVPLAWAAEFDVDPAQINPRGGAIALGHPLGASGARLMTTLMHHLEQTGGRYGLQTMCEAGGMANATIIEMLDPAPPNG